MRLGSVAEHADRQLGGPDREGARGARSRGTRRAGGCWSRTRGRHGARAGLGRGQATVAAPEGFEFDGAAFAPGGDRFVLTAHRSTEGLAALYETASGRRLADLGPAGATSFDPALRGPKFTPDGTRLAIPDLGIRRATLRVLEWPTLRPVREVALSAGAPAHFQSLGFPDAGHLAVRALTWGEQPAQDSGYEFVFDLERLLVESRLQRRLPGQEEEVLRLEAAVRPDSLGLQVWSADGRTLAATVEGPGGQRLAIVDGHNLMVSPTESPIGVLEFSPDGTRLLAALGRSCAEGAMLWDVRDGNLRYRLLEPKPTPEGDAPVSPDRGVLTGRLGDLRQRARRGRPGPRSSSTPPPAGAGGPSRRRSSPTPSAG